MAILCGSVGVAASVSTLEGRAGVCTGDGGSTWVIGCWASTLGDAGGFSLRAGWVWCSGGGRKVSRIQGRSHKSSVCSVAGKSLMAHDRKCRAWTMGSSGATIGCVRYEW